MYTIMKHFRSVFTTERLPTYNDESYKKWPRNQEFIFLCITSFDLRIRCVEGTEIEILKQKQFTL